MRLLSQFLLLSLYVFALFELFSTSEGRKSIKKYNHLLTRLHHEKVYCGNKMFALVF